MSKESRALPPEELNSLRQDAARRLREAELAAAQVAELCAKATRAARTHTAHLKSANELLRTKSK